MLRAWERESARLVGKLEFVARRRGGVWDVQFVLQKG
jgi:hypothetical protein